jgi:hypothetical protein
VSGNALANEVGVDRETILESGGERRGGEETVLDGVNRFEEVVLQTGEGQFSEGKKSGEGRQRTMSNLLGIALV